MQLHNFDATGASTTLGFTAKPAGVYTVILTKSDLEPNSKGDGKVINFAAQIQGGPLAGDLITFNANWENPNPTAVRLGHNMLKALCIAVGIPQPQDTRQLHNIPFKMQVGVTPDGKYNNVEEVFPIEGAGPVAQSKPTAVSNDTPPPVMQDAPPPVAVAAKTWEETYMEAGYKPNPTNPAWLYNTANPTEQYKVDDLKTKLGFNAASSDAPPPVADAGGDEMPGWLKDQQ